MKVRKTPRSAQNLRLAIELLPRETREAMLDGIGSEKIIVGAYADRSGGVCPMLAAHRRGGRTSFGSFARAWDLFAGAGRRSRRATERELGALRAYLESSLLLEEQEGKSLVEISAELRPRIAGSGTPAGRDSGEAARPGDRDRAAELRSRRGWAWLRPSRRYDRFLETLAAAEEQVSEQRAGLAERETQPA